MMTSSTWEITMMTAWRVKRWEDLKGCCAGRGGGGVKDAVLKVATMEGASVIKMGVWKALIMCVLPCGISASCC